MFFKSYAAKHSLKFEKFFGKKNKINASYGIYSEQGVLRVNFQNILRHRK